MIICVAALLISVGGYSKSMTELWYAMPESMTPYIDHNQRVEMASLASQGAVGGIDNKLQNKSLISAVGADYMKVVLSESSEMELKRLPYQDGDSVVCVVKTWKGPHAESAVEFYTEDWQRLDIVDPTLHATKNVIYVKPDSLSSDDFKALTDKIEFIVTSAKLSSADNTLTVTMSAPLMSAEDQSKIQAIMPRYTLTWDGATFK